MSKPLNNKKAHPYGDGEGFIELIPLKGEAMGTCATFNRKYICCNVHVLRSVHNCPFQCTYCFLQNYLNDGKMKVVSDVDSLMNEVKEKVSSEPRRLFRIGTWELGDSLALEDETGQAARLVKEFSVLRNTVLELKTKSDRVDGILGVDHKVRTIVSWSLNTEDIINHEEYRTAALQDRLPAMKKVSDDGYLIGLHFDPMILHEGWQGGYKGLVEAVFDVVDPGRVAWISIGSLRFNPEMRKMIENNYPQTDITTAEMVLGDDNKMRYVKPLRLEMYGFLYGQLRRFITEDSLVYLCMERWDVWEKCFGRHPDSIDHLDYIFAESLYRRFGVMDEPPEREAYEKRKDTPSSRHI